jgi:hypothetical protein
MLGADLALRRQRRRVVAMRAGLDPVLVRHSGTRLGRPLLRRSELRALDPAVTDVTGRP